MATCPLPWLPRSDLRKRPVSECLTPVLFWATCETPWAGEAKEPSRAGPLSRALFPPDIGSYLTSKLIGDTMPGSQMRKQGAREAKGLSQGHAACDAARNPGLRPNREVLRPRPREGRQTRE